ncbi:zinc finger, C2H2 type domain-containing protein [Cryptosporidium serpentis]
MGRKKRRGMETKPFCYYCNREFSDEKVLIQHQKAKHLKCLHCNRKLDTATGLTVHMLQVHKETLSKVPNAIAGRDNPELVIYGMNGVPLELISEKQKKLSVEHGIRQTRMDHNPHGNKTLALLHNIAQEFISENNLGNIVVPGMYGGAGFVLGAMPAFPGQVPIAGVMLPSEFPKTGGKLAAHMIYTDSEISPEENRAANLFNYIIINKHQPINITITSNRVVSEL